MNETDKFDFTFGLRMLDSHSINIQHDTYTILVLSLLNPLLTILLK